MPSVIEITFNYPAVAPVNVEIAEQDPLVIVISFANIGPKGDPGESVEGASYNAPLWTVDGNPGSPEVGENAFQSDDFIGATDMNYIIVNKVIEFINEDYLFNNTTGTITRNNAFQVGDKMVTPYKQS